MDSATPDPEKATANSSQLLRLTLAWLVVGLPLLWGVLQTLKKAAALFR